MPSMASSKEDVADDNSGNTKTAKNIFVSKSHCKTYIVVFVALFILNFSTITGGQLTYNSHVVEEIGSSTELMSPPEHESFTTQLSSGSPLDTVQNSIGKGDHSLTSSPIRSEYWNDHKNGSDCSVLERPALQSVQRATMCLVSDTGVCHLAQNLSLDHCGSSNKTASQRHNESSQMPVASLLLPNTTWNTSLAEKQGAWWFYPIYYLLSIIIRHVFNSANDILLFLALMLLLYILCSLTVNEPNSNVTNGSRLRNTSAIESIPRPPVDRSTCSSPIDSATTSANSSTDIQGENLSSESEEEEEDISEVWEEPRACSNESGETDVVGIEKLYLFNPVPKMEGRRCDNDENETDMPQLLRSFLPLDNEEPMGLQLSEEDNTQLLQDYQITTENVSNVLSPLPVSSFATIMY